MTGSLKISDQGNYVDWRANVSDGETKCTLQQQNIKWYEY